MKTITATVTLQFDALGADSDLDQAQAVVALVNEAIGGINGNPAVLAVLTVESSGTEDES